MMILSRALRGDAGALLRTAAHVFAGALVVTAIFAALWEGPAAYASHSSAPARTSASPSPTSVKYFIVPPAASGPAETLFDIAAKTLGAGNRFTQIFNLNKGRLQPNGGRLENASTIDPGWILQLPADAAGPGVHIGPLPGDTTPATPAASRPASGTAAARRSPAKANGNTAVLAGGALMVFGTAGLGVGLAAGLSRRRRASTPSRRLAAHARPVPRARAPQAQAQAPQAQAPQAQAQAWQPPIPGFQVPEPQAPGPQVPGFRAPGPRANDTIASLPRTGLDMRANDPGWPTGDDEPSWLTGRDDHPDWPAGGGDHPSWPAGSQDPGWPAGGLPELARW